VAGRDIVATVVNDEAGAVGDRPRPNPLAGLRLDGSPVR
jgi:hypothetical protein